MLYGFQFYLIFAETLICGVVYEALCTVRTASFILLAVIPFTGDLIMAHSMVATWGSFEGFKEMVDAFIVLQIVPP